MSCYAPFHVETVRSTVAVCCCIALRETNSSVATCTVYVKQGAIESCLFALCCIAFLPLFGES